MSLTIFISPHYDDAVLSCGERMQEVAADREVLTVLGGVPGELPLTTFDRSSGFLSGRDAVEERERENERAASVLDFWPTGLDFFDRQYGKDNDLDSMIVVLREAIDRSASALYVPLGLAHPDHDVVSRCAMEAVKAISFTGELLMYEDLPSRVWLPETVPARIAYWREQGLTLEDVSPSVTVNKQRRFLKQVAINCYRSQMWAVDDISCLVPERFWKVVF